MLRVASYIASIWWPPVRGRCIAFEGLGKGITARSIEGGSEVFEHVIPMGTTLLAGYVEGPKDAPDLAAIQDALRHAVARLDPRW